jgi:predicted amidohydrolase
MTVGDNKMDNIEKAVRNIGIAAGKGSDMVVLPEMFNCPYNSSKFHEYAEDKENGVTVGAMSKAAKELKVYLVSGSIPEYSEGKVYNTCFVFDKNGEIIGTHRKMHLFDVDVKGKIRFKESYTLFPGNNITVVETEHCKIGIAICYDIRFPELIRLMALEGAKAIIIPAAFNMVTGPAHWDLLIRGRAVDNQVFVAAASPARDENSGYVAYGNSMIADPWGNILAKAGSGEEIVYCDINLNELDRVRNEMPLLQHRRKDVYELMYKL